MFVACINDELVIRLSSTRTFSGTYVARERIFREVGEAKYYLDRFVLVVEIKKAIATHGCHHNRQIYVL